MKRCSLSRAASNNALEKAEFNSDSEPEIKRESMLLNARLVYLLPTIQNECDPLYCIL